MKRRFAANLALVAVFVVVLGCLLGTKGLARLGVEFPEWMGVNATFSQLEIREYRERPSFSLSAVKDGSYQEELEGWATDSVPLRDDILLAEASMERVGISLASSLMGYDSYPAFYGASYAICPDDGLVIPISSWVSEKNIEGMNTFAQTLNGVVKQYPSARFVLDQLGDEYSSSTNPTYKYRSHTYEKEVWEQNLESLLDPRVQVIWDDIDSLDEVKSLWLHTEHHWTLERALMSYNKIGNLLGWEQVEYSDAQLVCESWVGANGRHARFTGITDQLWDLPTDFSQLKMLHHDEEKLMGAKWSLAAGEEPALWGGLFNGYDDWWADETETVFVNQNPPNNKTCLLIGHSYRKPISPYIAKNYARVISLDVVNDSKSMSFAEYMDEYQVDDVVIQFGLTCYGDLISGDTTFLQP